MLHGIIKKFHSIPSFPQVFQGDIISEIDPEELKNKNFFQYIEIDYTLDIIYQLYHMNVKIYISKNEVTFLKPNIKTKMNMIKLTDNIQHLVEYHFEDNIGFIFNDPSIEKELKKFKI